MTQKRHRTDQRRKPAGPPRRSLLVFTEGTRTEDGYLIHWRRKYRDRVNVAIGDVHGEPLTLVNAAVEAKRQEAREERKGRGRAHDEVWCVFDRDDHKRFHDALDKAASNDIKIVISNPCIELWFILHFSDQTSKSHHVV